MRRALIVLLALWPGLTLAAGEAPEKDKGKADKGDKAEAEAEIDPLAPYPVLPPPAMHGFPPEILERVRAALVAIEGKDG
ncbi:hypothetical protein [Limimaricola pyoseonensis]|uniref:Uncharacterized protein n=1 Tax=Limimaricola pyoseonensis TaxID=521013 RepID=A0A1G7KAE6_9RHOB|nr:hypothetical protein [Limimaricola pyoseonensis]SDF33934.1 hypothetical protein SAMN04488567_0137 [Limimaricola pyoseonensis]